jgi:hypothetical protein
MRTPDRCLICKAFAPQRVAFTCKRCGAAHYDTRSGPIHFPPVAGVYAGTMATTMPIRFAYRPTD